MTAADPASPRAFRRAALGGSLLALVLDVLLLAGPRHSLVAPGGFLGGFFDAQARALLSGHLAIAPERLGFEGFVTDGATYEYFGPVPALLRLPVLAVTHALDGRLTQLSMLLALLVLLLGTAGLHARVRTWLSPAAAGPARHEAALVALLQLAVGGGVALYLLAQPIVYHETELWGAALAVASLWAVLGVLLTPSGRGVALAGLLCVLTVNTRVSVGLVPLLALAVAGAVLLARRPVPRRLVAGLALGALLAIGTSAAVNEAKFRQPFGIPIERQVASQVDPGRRAALAANHGTIFGSQFAPTTLLAALRPDAVGTARAFPWVGLPAAPPHVVGHVRFDTLQRSLSAPTSMALLCLLTLVGLVGAARLPGPRRWAALGLLAAAAAGWAGAVSIGYVTTRYLADAIPLLVLGGALGVQTLARTRRTGGPATAAAALLVLLGVCVNGGAGLLEQRLTGSALTDGERADWVRHQDRIDDALGRRPRGITTVATLGGLPRTTDHRAGDLAVVGRCDGLFVVDAFGSWAPVERTARTGRLTLRVRGGSARREEALAVAGHGAGRVTLVARRTAGGLRLAVRALRRDQPLGAPVHSGPGVRVELSFDPGPAGAVLATARVDGHGAAAVSIPRAPAGPFRLGADRADAGLHGFSGTVRPVRGPTPVCARLVRRAGLAVR